MDYLTVAEVCKKLGLESQTVQNMCKKRMFKNAYQSEDGDWLIPEDNFVTTREQDEKAETILKHIDRKNDGVRYNNEIPYIPAELVSNYYGVPLEKVVNWIKQGHLSGKQMNGQYFVPKEEFEYLKFNRDNDTTEKEIKKLLDPDFTVDWDVELDE